MVEPTYGRRRRRDRAACCIDREIVRLNPDLFEHCAQQCGLVLAIAVPMNKDFRGGMWLPASDPQLYGHVANVPLYKLRERTHLFQWSWRRSGQRRHFLFYFWGD